MIKHISVFTLEDKTQIDSFMDLLNECGSTCELIVNNQVGRNIAPLPPAGIPGPDFGDIVQIIDFNTLEDSLAYPTSMAHRRLIEEGPVMAKVTAIDFEY